ncbi:MAG TPA: hypothetical protein VKK31_07970 [Thermoanaerobaculia bacterium]|nr:hypothetical protein [Thermoanaerobaculia bacterium]
MTYLLSILLFLASLLGADPPARGKASASLFAPGEISTGAADELFATFAPDGKTIYLVRRIPGGVFTLHASSLKDGRWLAPRKLEISGRYKDQGPFVSPDGSKLFFYSNRPLTGGEPKEDDDIWVAERRGEGWSEPRNVGPPVNTAGNDWHPSVDGEGTLYFAATRPEGRGATDLYRARWAGDGYLKPENLGPAINTPGFEANPTISANGRLLLFTADERPDGLGKADLYVSFLEDGRWETPLNLGPPVNSSAFDFSPRLSPDAKSLLFSSNRSVDSEGRPRHQVYSIEAQEVEALARAFARGGRR